MSGTVYGETQRDGITYKVVANPDKKHKEYLVSTVSVEIKP